MARINNTGEVSVGTTSGAGRSINGLTGGGNTQTAITSRETTFMGGNPANLNSVGAVCMPNQAQRVTPIPNVFDGTAIRYNNSNPGGAWRQTGMSEFHNAYTTKPVIVNVQVTANGTVNQGRCVITVAPPADAPGTCSVYLRPLSTAWSTVNASNQITFTIAKGTIYTAFVKDINNCGANMEISWGGIQYTL